jgi:hypothetical protein
LGKFPGTLFSVPDCLALSWRKGFPAYPTEIAGLFSLRRFQLRALALLFYGFSCNPMVAGEVETMRGCVRDAERFKDHAGTGLL